MIRVLALALALAGCGMIKTSSTTATGTSGGVGTGGAGGGDPNTNANPNGGGGGGGGSGPITMPNLVGMTEAQASAAVKAAGFAGDMEQSRPVECENAPQVEGQVNCQDPEAGKSVTRTAMVVVNVYHSHMSEGGKQQLLLDSVVGMPPDQAKAAIKKVHPNWQFTISAPTNSGGGEIYDAKCGENKVCSTGLAGDPDVAGSSVVLYVNKKVKLTAPPPP